MARQGALATAFEYARDQVSSIALSSGFFDAVLQHEPKNAPGKGLMLAIFVDRFDPVQTSGLNSTSVSFVLFAQLRCSAMREPADDIDVDLIEAADVLCAGITADFDLGSVLRSVDLLGAFGNGLGGRFGYIDHGGHKYRVCDVQVRCVVNDVWAQG